MRHCAWALLSMPTLASAAQSTCRLTRRANSSRNCTWTQTRSSRIDLAVFDSGSFLLYGRPTLASEPRVVVMPATGGPLRDVRPPAGRSEWPSAEGLAFVEPGSDGQVYFAPADGPVYAIPSATPAKAPDGGVRRRRCGRKCLLFFRTGLSRSPRRGCQKSNLTLTNTLSLFSNCPKKVVSLCPPKMFAPTDTPTLSATLYETSGWTK